jgi:hypothetical protein
VQPFLHDRLQRLERLLEASNIALRAYTDQALQTIAIVGDLLDEAGQAYRTMGDTGAENELLALRAQLTSAQRGIDPLTSERVATRRRELERSVALRVLLHSGERLRTDHAQVRQRLNDARDQLTPMVLYAVQKGLVAIGDDRDVSQTELEHLWRSLLEDPESQASARHLAMSVASHDVLLLLADLLSAVR